MAVLGALNQSKVVAGPATVHLAAYPTGGYTGASEALKITALKTLFFAGGDSSTTPTPSVYADLDASGVEVKIKTDEVKFSPNAGGDYKAANGPTTATVTFTYKDMDASHIMDAFSCVSGDLTTVAAASGVAGKKTVVIGRAGTPLKVAILIRYPSSIVAGAFDHIYVPMATISPDWTLKLDKKNVSVCKLQADSINDWSLVGSFALPPAVLVEEVTAAAL